MSVGIGDHASRLKTFDTVRFRDYLRYPETKHILPKLVSKIGISTKRELEYRLTTKPI